MCRMGSKSRSCSKKTRGYGPKRVFRKKTKKDGGLIRKGTKGIFTGFMRLGAILGAPSKHQLKQRRGRRLREANRQKLIKLEQAKMKGGGYPYVNMGQRSITRTIKDPRTKKIKHVRYVSNIYA